MMGLAYLGAAALFLTVMFWVMYWAWQRGRANGGSALRASAFAFAGFLVVYLPFFWDLLPTMLVRQHYCSKDAGFSAQVAAADWYLSNRNEVESTNQLPAKVREAASPATVQKDGFERHIYFNGLLARDYKSERFSAWFVDVVRISWRTVDAKTGLLLATVVDYQTGRDSNFLFWLKDVGCFVRPPAPVGGIGALSPLDKLFIHDRTLRGEKT